MSSDKEIVLTVKVDFDLDGALKGINLFEQAGQDVTDEIEGINQRSGLSISDMSSNLSDLMGIGQQAFSGMIAASPALNAQLELAAFWFSEMWRVLGDALAPLIESFIPLLERLAGWFANLPIELLTTVAGFAGLLAVFMKIIPIIKALSALGTGMMGWIGLIVIAIQLLMKAWKENWGGIRDFFMPIWEQIKAAWEELRPLVEALWDAIMEFWNAIKPIIMQLWEVFKKIFNEKIQDALKQLKITLSFLLKHIKLVFDYISKLIKGDFKGAWEAFKNIFKNLIGFIKNIFKNIWDKIKKFFTELIPKFFKWGWQLIKNFFKGIWDGIKNFFTGGSANQMAGAIGEVLEGHSPPRKGPLKDINKWGVNIGGSFAEGIGAGIKANMGVATMPFTSGGMGVGGTTTNNNTPQHITNNIKIEASISKDMDIDSVTKKLAQRLNKLYERGSGW